MELANPEATDGGCAPPILAIAAFAPSLTFFVTLAGKLIVSSVFLSGVCGAEGPPITGGWSFTSKALPSTLLAVIAGSDVWACLAVGAGGRPLAFNVSTTGACALTSTV